jgi:hypothetical protein
MESDILSEKFNYFADVLHVFDELKGSDKINDLNMDTLIWDLFHDYMKSVGLFHVMVTHEEIMSDIDADAFDVIRFYCDKIVEMQKYGDINVPLRLSEYISKRADCFIPVILSLLYDIVSSVDVDVFERIHLKECVDQLKQGYIHTGIMNTDILISFPVTYNGDGINTSELLVKDIWRFGHHPLIITTAEIKNKDVTFQQNGITITHEFGSQDQLDMIDDHCLFTHDLVKVYNNED